MVVTFGLSVQGIQTILSSLSLGPLDRQRICLAATTGQKGCNTFSQPRNLVRALFSAMDSLAVPTVASPSWVLTGVVLVLWGSASLVGLADVSSGRAVPLNTSLSEKER